MALQVEYNDIGDCQPNLGNEVDVCGLTEAPHLEWQCNSHKNYSIVLIDLYPLGETNAPLLQYGLLWWVVDIPGCKVAAGKTIKEYQQPLPLYGSGVNRYEFNVFEQQPYPIDWSEEPYVSAT